MVDSYKMRPKQMRCSAFSFQVFIIMVYLATMTRGQGTRCRNDPDCRQNAGSRICCSKYGYCGPGKPYCDAGCIIEDVEFVGGDLATSRGGGGILGIENDDLCSMECEKKSGCRFYTYDVPERRCYLKASRGYQRPAIKRKTLISGSPARDGCDPEPICLPPFMLMNLQCVLIPIVPPTTTTTTTTTSTTEAPLPPPPTTTTIMPRAATNPIADTLLKALELCNNLGGFVPYNFLTAAQTSGRVLQGENTPDIFEPVDGPEEIDVEENDGRLLQVLEDSGMASEKLIQFEGFDEPLDGFYWLNQPSREGFCVASNPGLYHYRWVPCQQKVGIICERQRRYHLPKFAFPKTFINDPFSDFDVIQSNEISPPNPSNILDELPPPLLAKVLPNINQFSVNSNPLRPEINQISPNQTPPSVVVIEKQFVRPRVQLPEPRVQLRRKLFRFNGLENPYLNYHFNRNFL